MIRKLKKIEPKIAKMKQKEKKEGNSRGKDFFGF